MWSNLVEQHPEIKDDTMAKMMFDAGLFDFQDLSGKEREDVTKTFEDYLWDEYGIDMKDDLDWEVYRQWYMQSE